jgi:hypothetical protein
MLKFHSAHDLDITTNWISLQVKTDHCSKGPLWPCDEPVQQLLMKQAYGWLARGWNSQIFCDWVAEGC